jgi:hypothetical protein
VGKQWVRKEVDGISLGSSRANTPDYQFEGIIPCCAESLFSDSTGYYIDLGAEITVPLWGVIVFMRLQ